MTRKPISLMARPTWAATARRAFGSPSLNGPMSITGTSSNNAVSVQATALQTGRGDVVGQPRSEPVLGTHVDLPPTGRFAPHGRMWGHQATAPVREREVGAQGIAAFSRTA